MKNLIVSYDKLPKEIIQAIQTEFPEGWDDQTFKFRIPSTNQVFRALRYSTDTVNYVIKLEKSKVGRPEEEED